MRLKFVAFSCRHLLFQCISTLLKHPQQIWNNLRKILMYFSCLCSVSFWFLFGKKKNPTYHKKTEQQETYCWYCSDFQIHTTFSFLLLSLQITCCFLISFSFSSTNILCHLPSFTLFPLHVPLPVTVAWSFSFPSSLEYIPHEGSCCSWCPWW